MGTTNSSKEPSTKPLITLSVGEMEDLMCERTVQRELTESEWPTKLQGKTMILTSPSSRVSRAITTRVAEGDVYALLCGDTVECTAEGHEFRMVGPTGGLRGTTPKAFLVTDVEMDRPDGASAFSFEIR